jgi:hypothetical protein
MLKQVKQDYAVPGRENITIPFFDQHGRANFVVHEDNDRDGEQSILDWQERVKTYGVVAEVRGKPWAVCSPVCLPPYKLISFGSVGRAIYRVAQELKDGKLSGAAKANAEATMEAGMVDCTLWVDFLPSDVTAWLIGFHNRFHDGMTQHFLALLLATSKSRLNGPFTGTFTASPLGTARTARARPCCARSGSRSRRTTSTPPSLSMPRSP